MNGAELLVKCLENERIRYVFGLPGEETLEINEALRSSSVQFVTVRHEQAGAFMAEVYGRLTGKAGVCLATLGPGATNLVTGIADANIDRAPVVALTGQADQTSFHKESHQFIDIVRMFEPITKWTTRVTRASVIPEAIRKAFKVAEAEKPGACHIELPQDVANDEADGKPLPPGDVRSPTPDPDVLKRAAELINESHYPIILAGNGIIRSQAAHALRAFASKLRIPVAETFMAKGVMPADSDLSLFTIGLQARDYVTCGFDRADLVIAVGYDFVEYSPARWNPNSDKHILHIDATIAEIDTSYVPDIEVLGNISSTLNGLGEIVGPKVGNPAGTLRELVLSEMEQNATDSSFPVKPQRLIHDLRQVLKEDDIIVSDVGAHKLWVARLFPTSEPGSVIISNGLSSMGFALPGALAAKLVHPTRNIVAVCGDGGFMMSCHELETAKRLGLKVVVIIFRDDSYGSIKWKQMERYGHASGVDFGNPDFVALAKSFGIEGYGVEKAGDIIPMLESAMNSSGPAVVEVAIDYRENLLLTKHLGEMVCPI